MGTLKLTPSQWTLRHEAHVYIARILDSYKFNCFIKNNFISFFFIVPPTQPPEGKFTQEHCLGLIQQPLLKVHDSHALANTLSGSQRLSKKIMNDFVDMITLEYHFFETEF